MKKFSKPGVFASYDKKLSDGVNNTIKNELRKIMKLKF